MSFRRVFFLFILLELLIILFSWWENGITLTSLQTITRFSGQLSLIVFSFIFLLYRKPNTLSAWLSPHYYLLFSMIYGIHLIELFIYTTLADTEISLLRLTGGVLAYLFIILMPLLHHYFMFDKIKPVIFKISETIFVYYLWFIFFMTYLPRVQGKLPQAGGSYVEHVALLGWSCVLLGFKVSSVLLSSQQPSKH